MKKLFFVTYGGGHANLISLVVSDLIEKTDYKITVLALTSGYKQLKKDLYGCEVKAISDYMHLFGPNKEEIQKFGKKYLKDNYQKHGNVTKEETINYIGLSFFDLATKNGLSEAEKIYNEKGRRAFEPLEAAKRIIISESPDLLVSTSSPRFEIASIRAGKQLGIPTLQILDFFDNQYNAKEADYIGCSNDQTKKILEKNNPNNAKISSVGQPSIERTVMLIKDLDREKLSRKINIDPKKKTILVATQKLIESRRNYPGGKYIDKEEVYIQLFNEIAKAKKHNDFNVLLRIHPASENIESYSKILEQYPFIIFSNENLNVEESIAVCDLLVTHSSTIAIEAACAKKNVITFKHFYDIDYPWDEFTQDPYIFVPDLKDINKKITEVFSFGQKSSAKSFLPSNSLENIRLLIQEVVN